MVSQEKALGCFAATLLFTGVAFLIFLVYLNVLDAAHGPATPDEQALVKLAVEKDPSLLPLLREALADGEVSHSEASQIRSGHRPGLDELKKLAEKK